MAHKCSHGVGLAAGGVGVVPRRILKHGMKLARSVVIMVLSKASIGVPMVTI